MASPAAAYAGSADLAASSYSSYLAEILHINASNACSAWWGFCSLGERDQLAAVVTRLVKKNYLPPDQPTLHEMVATADNRLFHQIVASPAHVLAPLIPPSKSHSYNLRKRPHDLQVPLYQTNISDKNFITRTILKLNQT